MTRSAAAAMRTCGIGSPPGEVHMSTRAGRLLSAANVSGATNRAAASVRITSTSAPACTSLLHRSAALYAAIPPVTPSKTRLPASR